MDDEFKKPELSAASGGAHPAENIELFLSTVGFAPEQIERSDHGDTRRWLATINQQTNLELIYDQNSAQDFAAIVYLGINIASLPEKFQLEFLQSVLSNADMLIDCKASLVDNSVIISSTILSSILTVELLSQRFVSVKEQSDWLRKTILAEAEL